MTAVPRCTKPRPWVGAALAALAPCLAVLPAAAGDVVAAQATQASSEAAARAAIAANCERCHPPLPGGGWEVMTERRHDRSELAALLHRMAEEYSAFPTADQKAAIIDYLGGTGAQP